MTRYYPGATSSCGPGKILRILLEGGPKGHYRVRVIAWLYYDLLRVLGYSLAGLEHYVKKRENNFKISIQLTRIPFTLKNIISQKHFLSYCRELKMQLLLIKLLNHIYNKEILIYVKVCVHIYRVLEKNHSIYINRTHYTE